MSRKYLALLLLALVGVIITITVYVNGALRANQIYEYGDFSSNIPSTTRSGNNIEITWRPYQDAQATPSTTASPLTLTVLLVDEESASQQICGFWRSPIVLDVLHINNKDGSWYKRDIQIPQNVQSGTYELERQVKRGDGSYFCMSEPITINT